LSSGLSWSEILPGLKQFIGVSGRLQKQAITTGWLIDDSYNANAESVKAGIDALVNQTGLSILCLGAMAELGEYSVEAHQDVAEYAKQKGVDYLLVYGQAAQQMPAVFGEQGTYFESHDALFEAVSAILALQHQAGKAVNVLVKGSRSAQMETVSRQILKQFGTTNASDSQ